LSCELDRKWSLKLPSYLLLLIINKSLFLTGKCYYVIFLSTNINCYLVGKIKPTTLPTLHSKSTKQSFYIQIVNKSVELLRSFYITKRIFLAGDISSFHLS